MLTTLIRREVLNNLMTFRFAAAMFITLLLVVANTAVLIKEYERRLASYNTARGQKLNALIALLRTSAY